MTAIELEDVLLPSIVSFLAAMQLTRFARWTSDARKKHNLPYPRMTGEPNVERAIRAQQNSLEFLPVFMIAMWMSSLFFHQVPAALLGVVYLYSRHIYYTGYLRSIPERYPGFRLGVRCLMGLAGMTVIGFITCLLRMYTSIDLGQMARSLVKLQ